MNVDFERALWALDHSKMHDLLVETVQMYIELVDVHGYDREAAWNEAAWSVMDGVYNATVCSDFDAENDPDAAHAFPADDDLRQYDHTDYGALADYYDGVSRGQHD